MGFTLRLSAGFRALRLPRFDGVRRLPRAKGGNAAVEFAMVAPVLVLILTGIFTYGGYFLTAHTVQQLTNDAARAAIAGLDDDERLSLARTAVEQGISSQNFMRGDIASLTLNHDGATMTVSVTYDARDDLYWAFASLLPVPAPMISRSASIHLGGF